MKITEMVSLSVSVLSKMKIQFTSRCRQAFFYAALIFGFALSACGDQTADVTFTLTYNDDSVRTALESGEYTVRMFYTFAGLVNQDATGYREPAIIIEPSSAAVPRVVIANTNGKTTTLWHEATGAGYPFSAGMGVTLHSMILNKTSAVIGIEFLKTVPTTSTKAVYYYACIGPYPGILNKEALASIAAQGLRIYPGRSCGSCTDAESLPGDPTTNCANTAH